MKSILFYAICLFICNNLIGQSTAFISTDDATKDIEQLIATFEKVHYNPYFKTTKEEVNQIKEQLLNSWEKDSITLKKFMATGMKLTALLSGGHSYMDWHNPRIIDELLTYRYIPFTGKIDDQNHFVVTRSTHLKIKAGEKIKSINGIKIANLYKECMSYVGGIDAFKNAECEKYFPIYLFFTNALQLSLIHI